MGMHNIGTESSKQSRHTLSFLFQEMQQEGSTRAEELEVGSSAFYVKGSPANLDR